MRLLARVRARARREEGQAALEALIVFPIWIIVLTLFVNLLLFLGSAMLLQANVDRAAFEAAALGGVTQGSTGVYEQLRSLNGLGVKNVQVSACYLPGAPGPGVNNGYYTVHGSTFSGAAGTPCVGGSGGSLPTALCSANTTDCVPDGDYIFIEVTYQQDLWLFSSRTVRREALVISHSFQQ
jgi:uncharacterized membrane protein